MHVRSASMTPGTVESQGNAMLQLGNRYRPGTNVLREHYTFVPPRK